MKYRSFYSIFPGNVDTKLITVSNTNFLTKGDYERVPIFVGNKLSGQTLGQWIYFRSNNAYTNESIYFDNVKQNFYDCQTSLKQDSDTLIKPEFKSNLLDYIGKNNNQCLLPFRNNTYIQQDKYSIIDANTNYDSWITNNSTEINSNLNKVLSNFEFFKYGNYNNIETIISESHEEGYEVLNQYILRYEDIIVNKTNNSNNYFPLSTETQLSSVLGKVLYKKPSSDTTSDKIKNIDEFVGAFLYPNLLSNTQIISKENENTKYIDVGSSLSIPIVFEYFTSMNIPSITKSLYFDIKNSTIGDLMHYMIEVTGNYDFTTSSEVYQNVEFENIEIE